MKKTLITLAIILGLLIVALLAIPVFFKSDILKLIEKKSAEYINANLYIGEVNLSMFKNFPNLNVGIKDVTITGKDEFTQDTLLNIPLFEASVNLKSLISGKEIIINKIFLEKGKLMPTVSTTGKTNWDILISKDSTSSKVTETSENDENKSIRFNDVIVNDLFFSYKDHTSSTFADIENINLHVAGNFSETNTLISVLLKLNNITLRRQNSIWVSNTDLNWEAEIGANLQEQTFDIRKNDLAINELKLDLTGKVAVNEDKYNIGLQLNAPDTKFENLLALVPKEFRKQIENLKTSGSFSLSIAANGEYYKDHLPAFEAKFIVHDAGVKFPELPESINNINIDLNISNPGGSPDLTLINLDRMTFEVAGNPFNVHLKIANPNDPELEGGATGVINFENLKKALPLENITLQGVITADISFNGKYRYIEQKEYEKFIAKGSIMLNNILFKNKDFPEGITITQGSLIVTPAQLNLNRLQAKVYSSDFTLKGSIANYLPYFLKNETLKGNFTLSSERLNLNEFMRNMPADTTGKKQTSSGNLLEIPKNLNLQLSTDIKTILFDQLTINNVKGNINLADACATLNNLRMDMLKGTMVMNGKYNTTIPSQPHVNFDLNISNFDINSAYNSFTFIQKSIPVAMSCNGKISAAMNFSATLDKEMSPVMNTINGGGYIASQNILINDNPVMNNLSTVINNEELSRLSITQLKIDFKLQNGNIIIEPFTTTMAGNPVTISGSQSVDGKLDYTLSMNIVRKFFGKDINKMLQAIPGSDRIESLDIDAKIGGTLTKPEVKPDFSKAIKTVQKELEKELKTKAKDGIMKGLQKLFK